MRTRASIAGHPIHVMAVALPIGLWVFSLVCDIIQVTGHNADLWFTVAYITMAERNDTNGDSHNNGQYAFYITVAQPDKGGPSAIHAGEDLNPVKTLRMRYDAWRKTQPASYR